MGAEITQQTTGRIIQSQFRPPWWAQNRHVQTVWPRFFQKRQPLEIDWQRLDLPDGDFVDLAWTPKPKDIKGIVVLFHGLEGSVRSHYANDMMAVLHQQGWVAVMMHFRGCSTEANRLPRAYHSGDTEDALYFLEWLEQQYPQVPKAGLGFSLGANMLLKLLGENPQQPWLKAAVAISPPFKLAECANSIGQGFSHFYQKYLLDSMCGKLVEKMQRMDYRQYLQIPLDKVRKLKSFMEFDQMITAPLHGFKDAQDYYQRCSAIAFTKAILTPTLVLHAKDDPFMNEAVVPDVSELSPAVQLELSDKGGHVGFLQGSPWRSKVWLHQRVPDYIKPYLGS